MVAAWDKHGRLSGLAPLYFRRLCVAGLGNLPSLRLMSDTEVGSEYLGLLAAPGCEKDFLAALSKELSGQWALSDFCGLREAGWPAQHLTEAFAATTSERIYRERHPCSLILLPHDYEAYLASLPHKFRSNVRYRTNKLTKSCQVRLLRTTHEHDLEPHLKCLFAMHQARWWGKGNAGAFYDPRKRAFYRDVSAAFLRRGWLRFYHLEIDGVIRASQFGFVFRGILHSLQEAFDHEFTYSGVGGIGVVLRAMVIREAISEGLTGYDFLGGFEDYKTRWNTITHYTQRLRIGAPGIEGAVAFSATAGVRRMKAWGKRRLPGSLLHVLRRVAEWADYRQSRRVAAGSEDHRIW